MLPAAERISLPAVPVRSQSGRVLSRLGYWGLVALCIALPFEVTQHPVLHGSLVTLTNLTALLYPIAAVAGLAVAREWIVDGRVRQRAALLTFGGLMVLGVLSSLASAHRAEGLKWTFDLGVCALLWHAVPLFLGDDPGRRRQIAGALVAGGALAAMAGLLEILMPSLDGNVLSLFKAKPTVFGPYLRLSGTFEYANTAGGFFAAVLPLAIVLAVRGAARLRRPAGRLTRNRAILQLAGGMAAVVLMGIALVLTFSRGALLGAVAGLAIVAAATRNRRRLTIQSGSRPVILAGLAVTTIVIVAAAGLSSPATLRVSTQSDLELYRANLTGTPPKLARPDSLVTVTVSVRNSGPILWHTRGAAAVHVSYHWLLPDNRILVLDGVRSTLPYDLRPGESATLPVRILTPQAPAIVSPVALSVTWRRAASISRRTTSTAKSSAVL